MNNYKNGVDEVIQGQTRQISVIQNLFLDSKFSHKNVKEKNSDAYAHKCAEQDNYTGDGGSTVVKVLC